MYRLCTTSQPTWLRPVLLYGSRICLRRGARLLGNFHDWARRSCGHSRSFTESACGAFVAIGGQFGHSRPFTESACSRMAALCPMHILLTLVPVVSGICSHMSLRMWAFCLPFCARRSGHSSAFVCVCPMSVGCKSAPRPAAKVSGGRLLLRRSLAAVCPPPPPSEARCHTSARARGRRCTSPHTHTHPRTPTRLCPFCSSASLFPFARSSF